MQDLWLFLFAARHLANGLIQSLLTKFWFFTCFYKIGVYEMDSRPNNKNYSVIVGAETGLLKGVELSSDKKSWCNLNAVQLANREKEITALCWSNDNQTEFFAGLRDRTVAVYSQTEQQITHTYEDTGGEGVLKAVAALNGSLVRCTDKGNLKVSTQDDDLVTIKVGDAVSCMRQNPWKRHLVATGGKENDLKIWNLEEPQEPIFKAKNVRHDWLNLRVPVWVTDAAFLPGSEKIVTCTGHHQVRVYDPSTPQKRPVLEVEIDEYPLTCMSLRHGYNQAIVGNTHGLMALVDFRGKAYMVQKYKGFAGAIRSIQCHPDNGTVTSCGLDRFLRVHDIDNKHLLHKVYLKSRLNCLLVADQWDNQSEASKHSQTDQSEAQDSASKDDCRDTKEVDEIWEKMDIVGKSKKRKKIVEEDSGAFSEDSEGPDEDSEGEEEHTKHRKKSKPYKHKDSKKKKKTKS